MSKLGTPIAQCAHWALPPKGGSLRGILLRRVQHGVSDVLDVVQHGTAGALAAVVRLDDGALAVEAHRVVVEEARRSEWVAAQPTAQLRELLLQLVVVLEVRAEHELAALDVGDARLPEEVQEVDALDRDVAEAAELVGVPADAVGGGAGLELLPHRVRPRALEGVLFEDAGHDGGEQLGLGAVVGLTGEDDGFGVGLHGVGVLGDDDVVEPAADGAEVAGGGGAGALVLLEAVAELPPVFGGDDAALEALFAGFVFLQDGGQLLRCV